MKHEGAASQQACCIHRHGAPASDVLGLGAVPPEVISSHFSLAFGVVEQPCQIFKSTGCLRKLLEPDEIYRLHVCNAMHPFALQSVRDTLRLPAGA